MIERVIENWLTSVNERQYQIQFCQLLAAEGETVVYVSKHGPAELGKDVITIDPNGIPKCYQLKRGDVGLQDWRGFEGEVNQLVEIDPNNPALPLNAPRHQSYFVTNGTLSDPVLNAIAQRNLTWAKRGYGPLMCTQKHELVTRFRDASGHYFPILPVDAKSFLELYTANGDAPLDKEAFAGFVERLLKVQEQTASALDVRRAAASSVLFTNYALQNQTIEKNHWAVFEGWVITGAAILALAKKHDTPESFWSYSFELCFEQAQDALMMLCDECRNHEFNFVQGSPFSDGYIFRVRMTILAGLLSGLRLSLTETGGDDRQQSQIRYIDEFLLAQQDKMQLWGESAVPYFILATLGLERRGHHALAEAKLVQLIRTICSINGKGAVRPGMTNPYWTIERSLRLALGLELINREEFVGFSYTLQSLIHMLARRGLKQTLKRMWAPITEIDFATLIFHERHEWLVWKANSVTLDTRFPNRPESWRELLRAANETDSGNMPEILLNRPSFMPFFLLVYHHRCHPALVKHIDLWSTSR